MIRPKQRLSFRSKNKEWAIQNARYMTSICVDAIDPSYAEMLYRAANGELIPSDYTHITNPLNSDCDKHKKFPAKLRNYDIISPSLLLLCGEKRRRGIASTVIARNSNVSSIKADKEKDLHLQMLRQMVYNEFIMQEVQAGGEPDLEQIEELTLQKIQEKVNDIQDEVAIQGQISLDYMMDYNDVFSKVVEGFYHWLVTARVFSYRDLNGDEVIYDIVSPLEMRYNANSRVRFLEDAETIRRVRMTVNEVRDKFQGIKGYTKEVDEQIEAIGGYTASEHAFEISHHTQIDPGKASAFDQLWNRLHRSSVRNMYSDEQGVLVEHIIWDSEVKVGQLTTINIFGEVITLEVDEDFQPREDEDVEWRWVKQKWECYMIDDRFVVGWQPILHHQGSWGRPEDVKGPYNGRIINMKHVNPKSTVEKGLPFQIKHNILHYIAEKLMAKNMDQLVVLPLGLIPEKAGLDMEASMYYAQATNFLFVDDSNPKFANAIQGVKVMNSSLAGHLQNIYELMLYNIREWDLQIGLNDQRKGQMAARDGKAVTENAIFRSSVMTEELFAQYEEFEERDLNCMLELSRYAFSEGKRATFLNRDGKQILFDVLGEDYTYWDYLVKVSSSSREQEKLELARQQAQAIAQNSNGRFSPLFKLIKSNNISEILEEMEQLEEQIQQEIQQSQQAEQEAQIAIEQERTRQEELKFNTMKYKTDEDNRTKIEVARIAADAKLQMDLYNPDPNQAAEASAVIQASQKREEAMTKSSIEREKINIDREKSVRDNETKKYVVDKQLAIARENKSQ